jgi:hypothetical protein
MINKIKQFFCKHNIIWKWYFGSDKKAFYDDFVEGICDKCGKKFYNNEE